MSQQTSLHTPEMIVSRWYKLLKDCSWRHSKRKEEVNALNLESTEKKSEFGERFDWCFSASIWITCDEDATTVLLRNSITYPLHESLLGVYWSRNRIFTLSYAIEVPNIKFRRKTANWGWLKGRRRHVKLCENCVMLLRCLFIQLS